MGRKSKVDRAVYNEVKNYAKSHSTADTMAKFSLSRSTICQIAKSDDYKSWADNRKQISRASYEARRVSILKQGPIKGKGMDFVPPKKPIDGTSNKTINEPPFKDATTVKPITPLGRVRVLEQDGPVKTTKIEDAASGPMSYDTYQRAYKKLLAENTELKEELTKTKAELDAEKSKYESLQAEYSALQESQKAAPTLPQDQATDIEITVGNAVIKVSTRDTEPK